METINWPKAIAKNREALLHIVETLFAMIGLDETAVLATLPRYTRNYLLRILRPAESATRRLIVIVARGISVTLRTSGGRKGPQSTPGILGRRPRTTGNARRGTSRPIADTVPAFPFVDPRKRFDFTPRRRYAKSFPRITCIGLSEPAPIPENRIPSPGDELDATRLCARMRALKAALTDLDKQALRLARREARRDFHRRQPGRKPARLSPMRPGWPPGYRKRPFHEVDDVLRECHSLAVWAQRDDTS